MSLLDLIIGRPLANSEARAEQIGVTAGIPIFGLDALSSAAYGPEAALTLLIPLGALGLVYILPVTISIIILLTIVYFSYLQTIDAYPGGGGSYTVARENIGQSAGLLAASALMIDYVLTAAVGISAGVGALVSAVPSLEPHTLSLCLVILVIIAVVNLRGVREAGIAFVIPTFLFLGTLLFVIIEGCFKVAFAAGHPSSPVIAPPAIPAATAAVSAWMILQVFSSGCAAMTGVEAVSNGVRAFREPTAKNAQRTLTVIIALLIVLLAGIAYLVKMYGIAATDPGKPGYQSILSMLLLAVTGRGIFYYVSIGSILLVLALSANTAFADFPRLCRTIALDGFMPRSFSTTGRRLVYSQGIYGLTILTGVLLIVFGGVTDRLIPLYAVGAFLAFTLSQAGMVMHWRRTRGPGWVRYMLVNGLGAFATGVTVVVVLVAKFVAGAWIVLLLIPLLFIFMASVNRHYRHVASEIACTLPLDLLDTPPIEMIVPIQSWNKVSQRGLRLAINLSTRVRAVFVDSEDETIEDFRREWHRYVEKPALELGIPVPELVVLKSPFRFIITVLLDYVLDLAAKHPDEQIAVVVPELVQLHWWEYFLHNHRANVLKALLLLKGNQKILVLNVPWYLER